MQDRHGQLGGDDVEQHFSYWRVENGVEVAVSSAEARSAWAEAAFDILAGLAGTYRAVTTYGELAEDVQKASGIRTRAHQRNWIGPVLGQVVRKADRLGSPPLTALVVHAADGMVGVGYDAVLEVAGQPALADVLEREQHAAEARLECYKRFGAILPADGGTAALAPRFQRTLDRRRAAVAPSPAPVLCPSCRLQLPATGICDFC